MSEQLVAPNELPYCQNVLGAVVLAALHPEQYPESWQERPELQAPTQDLRVSDAYESLRDEIAHLALSEHPLHKEMVGSINLAARISTRKAPGVLSFAKNAGFMTWARTASSQDLLDYVEWNEASLRPMQGELWEQSEDWHARMRREASQFHDEGFLSAAGNVAFGKGLERTTLPDIVDNYHMALSMSAGNVAAYYSGALRRIGMSETAFQSTVFPHYLRHEYWHAATREAVYGEEDAAHINEDGANGKFGNFDLWVDEALTEHRTLASSKGQPEILMPYERKAGRESGIYKYNRQLLRYLLTKADEVVDIRELSDAQFWPKQASGLAALHPMDRINAMWAKRFPELDRPISEVVQADVAASPTATDVDKRLLRWHQDVSVRAARFYYPES